jgi:hypothetical protein
VAKNWVCFGRTLRVEVTVFRDLMELDFKDHAIILEQPAASIFRIEEILFVPTGCDWSAHNPACIYTPCPTSSPAAGPSPFFPSQCHFHHLACTITLYMKVSLKHLYLSTKLHDVISQKTGVLILNSMRTSNFIQLHNFCGCQ